MSDPMTLDFPCRELASDREWVTEVGRDRQSKYWVEMNYKRDFFNTGSSLKQTMLPFGLTVTVTWIHR